MTTLNTFEGPFIIQSEEYLQTPWGALLTAQPPENFPERDLAGNELFYFSTDDNPYPQYCITYAPCRNMEGKDYRGCLYFRKYMPEQHDFQLLKMVKVTL